MIQVYQRCLILTCNGDLLNSFLQIFQYKKFRNQVNNRKKSEENTYKSNKISEVAESPDLVWKSAKTFMGGRARAGCPFPRCSGDLIRRKC